MCTKLSEQDVLGGSAGLDGPLRGVTSAMSADEDWSTTALLELAYGAEVAYP
jgi:hypothetical protein